LILKKQSKTKPVSLWIHPETSYISIYPSVYFLPFWRLLNLLVEERKRNPGHSRTYALVGEPGCEIPLILRTKREVSTGEEIRIRDLEGHPSQRGDKKG
jgi:hypothetical protein